MQNRQIILDTETTGLYPELGERIIEIACLEIIDGKLTGKQFQTYLNPPRKSDPAALKVHGLTREFLADKPSFSDVWEGFVKFINGADVIAHNAPFDVNFLNYELTGIGQSPLRNYCKSVIDTKKLALALFSKEFLVQGIVRNSNFPEEQAVNKIDQLKKDPKFMAYSLDNLCKFYNISLEDRKAHGALIDCQLLAKVYFELQQEEKKQLQASNHKMFKPLVKEEPSASLATEFAPRFE